MSVNPHTSDAIKTGTRTEPEKTDKHVYNSIDNFNTDCIILIRLLISINVCFNINCCLFNCNCFVFNSYFLGILFLGYLDCLVPVAVVLVGKKIGLNVGFLRILFGFIV